ncbi:barrier-to-autointegration factor-like [Ctenocephalides felis]|uniref:barrier-to-autointegration factor-like n=1 Tax=Ctenocephalides felis TaxID=7515 RepID=UPI000E6E3C26|nr:barrier-to-autointegration factor-like [Ctenocephalides felis]XP_026468981.1 barrier-to-autointegration factor-like [Ctenocephalides felis]
MSTSQKHRNFVSEPMGNKPVTEVPGVGRVLGQRLNDAGYSKASNLLGSYLTNEGQFKRNFQSTCYANDRQANEAQAGLRGFTNNFID